MTVACDGEDVSERRFAGGVACKQRVCGGVDSVEPKLNAFSGARIMLRGALVTCGGRGIACCAVTNLELEVLLVLLARVGLATPSGVTAGEIKACITEKACAAFLAS